MKKITQNLTKYFWRSGLLAITFLFSLSINSQDLSLKGILDLQLPSGGSDGKAIHVVANVDIPNLVYYGIGVANNGGGSDNQEYTFPSISVSAGDNILVVRSTTAMATYLEIDESTIIDANDNDISQNGDDAIELYYNGEVIETFGEINVDGSGQPWEYLDSWAYKENGTWTYGGVECTNGSTTSAGSNCPYPYTGIYSVGTAVSTTYEVTFSVNTQNIQVGNEGMYVGGGILGEITGNGALAYQMSDDDGDGTYTVVVSLPEGTSGNYVFLNSPTAVNDWDAKEVLAGLECADADNFNDRILEPVTADTTLLHCFGSCETDGSCGETTSYNVTFELNTSNIEVGPNGMFVGGGIFGGPDALPMSDDDGDGVWTVTTSVAEGISGNFTYINSDTVNYAGKEDISGQECADADNFNDRVLNAVTEDTLITNCFGTCGDDGSCPDVVCGQTITYTQVANGDYTVALTAPGGQLASVTVNGDIESGYDFIYVTDGAGNALNADQNTGVFTDSVFTSTDGTISVNVTNDGSVQNGDVTLAFECIPSGASAITFNVDMNAYSGSQYEDFGAFVNGEFTGWCGTCEPMTDDDGDGIWTTTLYLENGTYFWKYTVNGWNDQESFNGTEVVDGCTAQNGDNIDRFLVVNGDQTLDTVFFNMCAGETPGSSLELQGIIDFTVPSGGSDGKAIHVVATENIPNLAYYGIGVANNGGGTDGQEFTFPSQSMAAGQHYLAARSVDAMNTYMDASSVYDVVSSEGEGINSISQNGDDAIELYMGGNAVELFGELDVDGSGQPWEYLDSWAYKVDGAWTYGEVDTTDGTETICEASTPYPFADCSGPGCGDSWEYTYVNNEDGATILYTFSNGGDSSVLSVTVTGQTETGYDNLIITDGAGAELYNASGDHTGQVVTSGDGVINIAISSDTSYAPGSDQLGNGTAMTFDATCEAAQNAAVIALLESGSWRVDAETAGHMGVGPDSQFYAEWWNANPWDKWETGLYDDRWSFAAGTMTHDTGDDGAIFGKKPALDAAFPDNTAYDADNGDDEYLYYIQDDYTDTYTVSEEGAETTSVTMAGIGQVGFFVGGAEHIVLESTETTMYLRNLGTEGVGNSWYHRLTTAEALSTVDAMVLDMRIYPNPSNGSYVTIQTPVNGVKYVEVFDITGKRLINTSLSADTLDVSSMSSGMYLVKVTVEGQSKTSKLIIR